MCLYRTSAPQSWILDLYPYVERAKGEPFGCPRDGVQVPPQARPFVGAGLAPPAAPYPQRKRGLGAAARLRILVFLLYTPAKYRTRTTQAPENML